MSDASCADKATVKESSYKQFAYKFYASPYASLRISSTAMKFLSDYLWQVHNSGNQSLEILKITQISSTFCSKLGIKSGSCDSHDMFVLTNGQIEFC